MYIFASLVTAFFVLSCATAPVAPTRQARTLNTEQLKKLVDEGSGSFLVDTRTEYEFRKGRIPGAVNIPPHRFDVLATLLPKDLNVRLVFYCRGSG
jgi:rhodanese-related sulfurtransferase